MKDITLLLRSLGFTDSECKTYLSSLENGSSTVIELTKITHLSRQATYLAIEALTNRGLMSSFQKNKKTLYTAESPERLSSLMERQRKEMEEAHKDAEGIIEELKLLQRGEKPVVKMLEGKEGVKAIQDDILKTHPDIVYEIGNYDRLYSLFPKEDFFQYQIDIAKAKIPINGIILYSKYTETSSMVYQVSQNDFSFLGDILIYGNKVSLSNLQGKNISILIESEIIAQTMKELIRMAMMGVNKKTGPSGGINP